MLSVVRAACAPVCAYARLWLPGASPGGEALSHGPQILARGPQICHLVEDDLDPAGREPLVRVHPVLCTARRAGLEVSRAREGLAPLARALVQPLRELHAEQCAMLATSLSCASRPHSYSRPTIP